MDEMITSGAQRELFIVEFSYHFPKLTIEKKKWRYANDLTVDNGKWIALYFNDALLKQFLFNKIQSKNDVIEGLVFWLEEIEETLKRFENE